MVLCNSINDVLENETKRWFVIYTRSRAEKVVEKQLKRFGINTFLPQILKTSLRKDRAAQYLAPLFPSYLFVNLLPTGEMFSTALAVGGVVNLLRDRSLENGPPAPVPDTEVDSLKLLLSSERVLRHQKFLKRGDSIRITSGPLAGCEGKVVKRSNKTLLVVSINLMQRSVAVTIDDLCVEKMGFVYRPNM